MNRIRIDVNHEYSVCEKTILTNEFEMNDTRRDIYNDYIIYSLYDHKVDETKFKL